VVKNERLDAVLMSEHRNVEESCDRNDMAVWTPVPDGTVTSGTS
jgi:hypothetical protein